MDNQTDIFDTLPEKTRLRGFGFSVHPLRDLRKHSIDKWNTETPDDDHLWQNATGLAVNLGPDNERCIDLDGLTDARLLPQILDELDLPPDYPWTVNSPHGVHIHFRCADTLPGERSTLTAKAREPHTAYPFKQVELLWDRHLITMPGTATTDGSYTWRFKPPTEKPATLTLQTVLDAIGKIAVLPGAQPTTAPGNDPQPFPFLVGAAVNGERNTEAFRYAGHLKTKGIPEPETLSILTACNRQQADPLPQSEIASLVRSAYKNAPASTQTKTAEPLNSENGADLLTRPEIPVQWLVEGTLELESMAALYGPPGVGKSLATDELGIRMCQGRGEWLGHPIMLQGNVLLLRNEGSRARFVSRFKRQAQALGLTMDEARRFEVVHEFPTVEEAKDRLWERCSIFKPSLVILDSLYMSHNADENSASDMKALGRTLQELTRDFGSCVLVIHHSRKHTETTPTALDNFRGAAIGAMIETAIEFRKSRSDETKRFWRWVKLRNGADADQVSQLGRFDGDTFLTIHETALASEKDHLGERADQGARDFKRYFDGKKEMLRSDLRDKIMERDGASWDTAYRWIKEAAGNTLIVKGRTVVLP